MPHSQVHHALVLPTLPLVVVIVSVMHIPICHLRALVCVLMIMHLFQVALVYVLIQMLRSKHLVTEKDIVVVKIQMVGLLFIRLMDFVIASMRLMQVWMGQDNVHVKILQQLQWPQMGSVNVMTQSELDSIQVVLVNALI